MTAEETIASLETQLKQALERLAEVSEQLRVPQARIQELEQMKATAPAFVKANVKKPEAKKQKPRKQRDAQFNRARRRARPTQMVEQRLVECPDCHLRLGGISLARVREVIDIPAPPPVEVTHHRIYTGWCAECHRWYEAPLDVQEQVVGQGRIGVRLASLIATLRTLMRLPIRQIQAYLLTLHGVTISIGEIVELLHRLKEQMQPHLEALKRQIRASPAVQADETGWREDGSNGYIWSVCTPSIRYYEYHHSRGGEVVKSLIGAAFGGALGGDIYDGYNIHQVLAQRCWVSLLGDIHDLKEDYPHDEPLHTWASGVKTIYEQAVAWAEQGPDTALSPRKQQQARAAQQHAFEQHLWQLCQPYVRTAAPQHTLCERVERFLPELFVFVAVPGVPAHNNLAERSIRPLVVARKISGGTRSPKGSQNRMGLARLFGTWMVQQLNPFSQCLATLTMKSSLGQV